MKFQCLISMYNQMVPVSVSKSVSHYFSLTSKDAKGCSGFQISIECFGSHEFYSMSIILQKRV